MSRLIIHNKQEENSIERSDKNDFFIDSGKLSTYKLDIFQKIREKHSQSKLYYQVVFMAYLAIYTKLANIDEPINQQEKKTISHLLLEYTHDKQILDRLIEEIISEPDNNGVYLRAIGLFIKNSNCVITLISNLFFIALADDHMYIDEINFIKSIAIAFDVEEKDFFLLMKRMILSNTTDPYSVLSVTKNANLSTIKKAYYQFAHKYHPDHLTNITNLDPIYLQIASKKFMIGKAAFNQLYKKSANGQ